VRGGITVVGLVCSPMSRRVSTAQHGVKKLGRHRHKRAPPNEYQVSAGRHSAASRVEGTVRPVSTDTGERTSGSAVEPHRTLRRDAAAEFAALFARHQGRVRAVALRRGMSWSDADDVAQETFVRAWTMWPTLDPDRVESWLSTVARNITVDHARASSREDPTPTFDETDLGAAPGSDAHLDEPAVFHHVRVAVGELPDDRRAVVVGWAVEERDYRELSKSMRLSESVLRARKHRAMQTLARRVRELSSPLCSIPVVGRVLRRTSRLVASIPAGLPVTAAGCLALAITAGPFVLRFGAGSPAESGTTMRLPVWAASAGDATARTVDGWPSQSSMLSAGSDRSAVPDGRQPGNHGRGVCVRDACLVVPRSGAHAAGDVLTVHLPQQAGGDQHLSEDYVALCQVMSGAPDPGVAECHTKGNPDYAVSPPPPPTP
jgi:RNA polymerase sigma-70 factor (ECF subfamily)